MDKVRIGIIGLGGLRSNHKGYISRGEIAGAEIVAVDDADPVDRAGADQLGLGVPIGNQGDDVGVGLDQPAGQPGADHAGGASDEDATARPGGWIDGHQPQTFQGASPRSHISLSIVNSR